MPFPIIPDKFKSLWNVWDLRVAVILSLFCQILLISIASLRKRTGKVFLTMFVWSAYLLADWIATYALGLIASGMASDYSKPALNEDLITFWAPFLLVHLGGPHNITAFALEDNELWLRHLLQLIVHLITIAYVFTQSIPNELWIPTALIYLAGFIKYAERTRSLYLASLGALNSSNLPRPTAGSNYAQLMQTYKSRLINSIPVDIIISAEAPEVEPPDHPDAYLEGSSLKEIEVVQTGYSIFNKFKGLIGDLTYSIGYHEWQGILEIFFKITAIDAFKILEVELNFMYDLLYTKMAVVHGKRGFIFRFVCLVSIVIALGCFVSHHKHHKNEIHEFDIFVTYILLVGALVLDISAIFKLIFSDWTIAKHENSPIAKLLPVIFKIRENISFDKNYRWSKSLSQHSLITYCLDKRFRRINQAIDWIFGANDFMDEILHKKFETITEDLKKFVFKELREKAVKAKTSIAAKEICSWRGEGVILQAPRLSTTLEDSVTVEYDESILRWHVATELCYHTSSNKDDKDDKDGYRRYCKILSEYMMYLLVMRPTMMSAVLGIVQVRFQDTCEEAKNFFGSIEGRIRQSRRSPIKACESLLEVDTSIEPGKVKGDTSQSVLFDGCILAKDLLKLETTERWKIMSQVWVELVCYAASHCRAHAHAQQLSKGGEFITFVWLLMIHFGLGEPFRVDFRKSRFRILCGHRWLEDIP